MSKVERWLTRIGIYGHLKGKKYLRDAVKMVKREPDKSMTALYNDIAAKYKTTPARVERDMRFILQSKITDEQYRIIGIYMRPRNGEFIYHCAEVGR
jgi:hypothetical protein